MYGMFYMVCLGLFLAIGLPIVLAGVCGMAQMRMAEGRGPCAFALPAAAGMSLLLAVYVKGSASGLELMVLRMVQQWAAGAFAGTVAGWVAAYAVAWAARNVQRRQDGL